MVWETVMRPRYALWTLLVTALAAPARAQNASPAWPPVATRSGVVLAADGTPAPTAVISIPAPISGAPSTLASTAADGSFTASTSAEHLFAYVPHVGVALPQYAGSRPLRFHLSPAADLNVRVVTSDGKPIPGVEVAPAMVWSADYAMSGAWLPFPDDAARAFAATTDADGKCILHGLPRNLTVILRIDDPRFARTSPSGSTSLTGPGPFTDTQVLYAAGDISGRLVHPETGAPMAGMHVVAKSPSHGRYFASSTAVTDATGAFRLTRLPPARYTVSLDEPQGQTPEFVAATAVDLAEGAHAAATLTLTRGGLLTGLVRDAATGAPVPDVMVGLTNAAHPDDAVERFYHLTGPDGRFTFRVPAGEQRPFLMATPDDYLHPADDARRALAVAPGQTLDIQFDLQPDPAPVVEGTLTDLDGTPIPFAWISSQPPGATAGRSVVADVKGRFRLHAAAGTPLRASYPGFAERTIAATPATPTTIHLPPAHAEPSPAEKKP
jgi:hypothetical protein